MDEVPNIQDVPDQRARHHVDDIDLDELWPASSRYYDPLVMNATQISDLLTQDTSYPLSSGSGQDWFQWHLRYVYFADGCQCLKRDVALEDDYEQGVFSPAVTNSRMTVIELRQKRRYMTRSTVSKISVDRPVWLRILRRFEVLPSFLELLHSNNGGTLSYVSYDLDSPDRPTAFHVGYKMGDWGNEETAVYGRYDIETGCSFVLMLGTHECLDINRAYDILSQGQDQAGIFHIIHAMQSTTLDWTEKIRWGIDYETQRLENMTGVSAMQPVLSAPLAPEQLRFNKSLQVTADFARNLAWGSARVRENFQDFGTHLAAYRKLMETAGIPVPELRNNVYRNLVSAAHLKSELARTQLEQIRGLQDRLTAQIEITKTLMAQRDTELSIAIAKSTKRDSELMRGIAAVTMVFLPATFVATFFSMVFFHVGDEHNIRLMVDQNIWLYPVVTLPLTIIMGAWTFAWSLAWSKSAVLRFLRGKRKPELEEKSSAE